MASDSPAFDQAEYQPQPGRSTPPPTTSYSKPDAPKPEESTAIEPKEDKDEKGKDEGDFSRPDANPGYKPESNNESKRSEFHGGGSGDKKSDKDGKGKRDGDEDGDKDARKLNGGDVLDAQWVRPVEQREEKEEENCAVNCIYYTMQCCECTIT